MSRIICSSIILAGLCLPVTEVYAENGLENIRIVTGVSLGYSTFSFPEKLDHDISFPSTNLALVATMERWQLALNGGFTLEDATISEEEDIGKASRNDLDLSIAYQASKKWALFAGFKSGKTKMRFVERDTENEVTFSNESYSQKGPFIGASYSWQFENAGRLSISLAYASLNATNNFAANTDDEEEDEEGGEDEDELEFDDLTGRVKGDLTGLSYAIAWTMPLSSNLLFQTRLKLNDYQQDIQVEETNFKNINENFTTLHVGLAYVF